MELANSATARYLFTSWNVIKIFIISNCVQPLQYWQTLKHRLSCVLCNPCRIFLWRPISCPVRWLEPCWTWIANNHYCSRFCSFYVIFDVSLLRYRLIRTSQVRIPCNYFFLKRLSPSDCMLHWMIYRYLQRRANILYILFEWTRLHYIV